MSFQPGDYVFCTEDESSAVVHRDKGTKIWAMWEDMVGDPSDDLMWMTPPELYVTCTSFRKRPT